MNPVFVLGFNPHYHPSGILRVCGTVYNVPGDIHRHTSVTTEGFTCIKILKNVSCEYDRWVVETQLCKLRDTSDTLIGRACAVLRL